MIYTKKTWLFAKLLISGKPALFYLDHTIIYENIQIRHLQQVSYRLNVCPRMRLSSKTSRTRLRQVGARRTISNVLKWLRHVVHRSM